MLDISDRNKRQNYICRLLDLWISHIYYIKKMIIYNSNKYGGFCQGA